MDKTTLKAYLNYEEVSWLEVKTRLMLNERKANPHLTDNMLWAALDHYEIDSLTSLLTKGLKALANKYITVNEAIIRKKLFGSWQELLCFCPPLILIAASDTNISSIQRTALLSPNIDSLNQLKENNGGFNDLHIHLNGSTETDILWQDALYESNQFRKNFKDALKKELYAKEQNEQENVFDDSDTLFKALNQAKALRYYIVESLGHRVLDYPDIEHLTTRYSDRQIKREHPFRKFVYNTKFTDLHVECLMYREIIQVIENRTLDETNRQKLTKAFHHYLLILGAINRFVVQQMHQNGFQQFQKITVNNFREYSEKTYAKRFEQLHGNDKLSNFKIVEGRFAPKNTPAENEKLINKIRTGWYSYKEKYPSDKTELRLVCHFIKKMSKNKDRYYHESMREGLWQQAAAIKSLRTDSLWFKYSNEDQMNKLSKLVAIDAAASEFDAPPEVFASIFHFLRLEEKGKHSSFKNITFHAGEDFFHLTSGLRAIYEAIYFLGMGKGDRIGHGTALGVKPQLWKQRMGGSVYIRQGEWLDNLIFIRDFLNRQTSDLLKKLDVEIKRHIKAIYSPSRVIIKNYIAAWKLRGWDPQIYLGGTHLPYPINEEKLKFGKPSPNVLLYLKLYQTNRTLYNKKIYVDDSLITSELIEAIQNKLMQILESKNIVIETLPTSNVRIGVYKHHHEHHLRNWISEDIISSVPRIVVGSDDTGIFATNIYNEFAHIHMMYDKNQKEILEKLIDQSESSVFTL